MNNVITACGIYKKYSIASVQKYYTLRDAIVAAVKSSIIWRASIAPGDNEYIYALRDVSFTVEEGDRVGIIGRNGAGKSTLLKVLSRITYPNAGEVRIKGRIGSLLEVGTGFNAELTGRENIYLNGSILGMKRAEISRKFEEIVEFSGINAFLDTPVKKYSSGMYMRLAFAVAAHLDTEILLIDEVLAVGDAEFQKRCLTKMNGLSESGRTILFVSHNMNAVQRLCNKVIMMSRGGISEYSQDVHGIIKRYVGSACCRNEDYKSETLTKGNKYYQHINLRVTDSELCDVEMPCSCNKELYVLIECYIEENDPSLTFGYALYTEEGQLLYWSYQTDTEVGMWPKMSLGRNRVKSKLPYKILNEGVYRIEVIASLHAREWIIKPGEGQSFYIELCGGLSDSPLVNAKPGILAIMAKWENV